MKYWRNWWQRLTYSKTIYNLILGHQGIHYFMKFNIFSKLIFNNFLSINFLGHTTDERAAALCPSSTTTIPTANQKIPTTTATEKRRWMPPLWTDIESRCWARFQEKRCEVQFRMAGTRWDDWEMKTQPRPLQLRLFQDQRGHRGRMIAIRYYDCQDWAFLHCRV